MKRTVPGFLLAILFPGDHSPAVAQFSMTDPTVERGELIAEWLAAFYSDGDVRHGHELAVSYGLTSFWAPSLTLSIEKSEGEDLRATSVEWSNVFALGKFGSAANLGLELDLSAPLASGEAFGIAAGPALSFSIAPVLTTWNATFGQQFWPNREDAAEFGYGFQALYATNFNLDFGIEAYGVVSDIGDSPPLRDTEHCIGPALNYLLVLDDLRPRGELSLSAGVLFGLTPATADQTYELGLSYDLDF